LKEGSVGRRRQRFRDSLAVGQMACSVVLLIGALLVVRSFVELRRVDLGFNPARVLTARVTLPPVAYAKDADAIRVMRTLKRGLADLPGVQAVGATRLLPLTGTIGNWSITQEGRPKAPGENPNGDWQVVTPGYFESMGIRLVRGRFLLDTDDEHAPVVAVINETMAARYWPGQDAIGKRFRIGGLSTPWVTIVGLSGEVRHNTVTEKPRAEMYIAHAQWGIAGASTRRAMTFTIRTTADPLAIVPRMREVVRSIDPTLPVSEVRTLDAIAADALSQARFTMLLLGLFAALALTLAAVGVYSLTSLLIARRRKEIGIRIALGARTTEIVAMVVGRGIRLAVVGVGLGLLTAAGVSRVMVSVLYAVAPTDPLTFVAVAAILLGVALLACVIPAARAARLDPIAALRQE
jgi:putative ABC transport system permease protein